MEIRQRQPFDVNRMEIPPRLVGVGTARKDQERIELDSFVWRVETFNDGPCGGEDGFPALELSEAERGAFCLSIVLNTLPDHQWDYGSLQVRGEWIDNQNLRFDHLPHVAVIRHHVPPRAFRAVNIMPRGAADDLRRRR
jgi:hypothetical protein